MHAAVFLWRSIKKRFCESVRVSKRRVVLERNVLRPEFFLHLDEIWSFLLEVLVLLSWLLLP